MITIRHRYNNAVLYKGPKYALVRADIQGADLRALESEPLHLDAAIEKEVAAEAQS